MSNDLDRRIFVLSVCFFALTAAFVYGLLVGAYKIWPHDMLAEAKRVVTTFTSSGSIATNDRVFRAAPDAARDRIAVYAADEIPRGIYVFLGSDDTSEHYEAWAYDHTGREIHTWRIDYAALDPDGPVNGSDMPHGMHVFQDGSIMLNFGRGGDVMARLDACGRPLWVKDGIYHHSFHVDEDGNGWTWLGYGSSYSQRQDIVRFDPDTGSILETISLAEDIIRPLQNRSVILSVQPTFEPEEFAKDPPKIKDFFHPNDVETLPLRLENVFPDFKRGDLLLSFRNIHLVAVYDPTGKQLKWWSHGPWRYQHDPDFTADGQISVFNNNTYRKHSSIIKINPTSGEISNELSAEGFEFYSGWMGKHQYLPNEEVLIVSPGEGRALLLSPRGRKLLEFNNVVSESHNAHVENGVWLPEGYFDTTLGCAENL